MFAYTWKVCLAQPSAVIIIQSVFIRRYKSNIVGKRP